MHIESSFLSNRERIPKDVEVLSNFSIDDEGTPLGIVCEVETPFRPVLEGVEKSDCCEATQKVELQQPPIVQLCRFFSTLKKNGFEKTSFEMQLNVENVAQRARFEVTQFDTAKMQVQIAVDAPKDVILHLFKNIASLAEIISKQVYPYEVVFQLPPSIRFEPINLNKIKELFKEHRTVYGVNEDEQAP